MGFSFIPKHLQRTRKEVEATHKSKNIIADMFYLSVDDELEYLIKSLVKLGRSGFGNRGLCFVGYGGISNSWISSI